ncbi:hypothetical protein IJJ08_00455 [bacterium]|nr:hypothetical protein [bacterium]
MKRCVRFVGRLFLATAFLGVALVALASQWQLEGWTFVGWSLPLSLVRILGIVSGVLFVIGLICHVYTNVYLGFSGIIRKFFILVGCGCFIYLMAISDLSVEAGVCSIALHVDWLYPLGLTGVCWLLAWIVAPLPLVIEDVTEPPTPDTPPVPVSAGDTWSTN